MFVINALVRRGLAVSMGMGLLVAAGSAAQARDSGTDSGQQQYRMRKSPDGTIKYCTRLPAVTGSRMRPMVCKTVKQWKEVGVDLNID
jgi:hypothetical protein